MSAFERLCLWLGSAATAVTGVALLWMKYVLEPMGPWSVINHPLQPWILKLHILVAPLLVFALGVITLRHVWEHIRLRVRRGYKTGMTAAVMAISMVLTGYLVQVVTNETWLGVVALAHIGTGLVYLAGLVSHQVALLLGRSEEADLGDESGREAPPPPRASR